MNTVENKDFLEALNRIFKAILQKPVLKSSIRSVLANIEPDNAPQLVRTLLWEDSSLMMAFLDATPSIMNACIKALDEVLVQIEKFPPEFRRQLTNSLMEEIDQETLNRAKDNLKKIVDELAPIFSAGLSDGANTSADSIGGENNE